MSIHRVVLLLAAVATPWGCSATPKSSSLGATTDATEPADAAVDDLDAAPDGSHATPSGSGAPAPAAEGGRASSENEARTAAGAEADGGSGASAEPPTPTDTPESTSVDSAAPADVAYVELEAEVTVIESSELSEPSDLAFNPYVADELWVVNRGDSSSTIIQNASRPTRSVLRRKDPEGARHFMPQPTGLAFGARETTIVDAAGNKVEGTFATCPEAPDSFMGPTLWTSDLRIFGISKEDREPPFNGPDTGAEGPGSHIDMLHRTPSCTGIAWEGAGNVYWTYSGTNQQLVRYDFAKDHGIGNDDHSDGSEWRYTVSGIRYVPGVPSHLAWDTTQQRLFVVDTGNARVVTFDPATANAQSPMSEGENVDKLAVALDVTGAELVDFVDSRQGLKLPAGVELHAGRVYVTDNETSTVFRFGLQPGDGRPGTALGKLHIDLPPRSLAGLTFGPDGKLYLVDMLGSRVLRSETDF